MRSLLALALLVVNGASGFVPQFLSRSSSSWTARLILVDRPSSAIPATAADFVFLQDRVRDLRLQSLEREWSRPPNTDLSAEQFCVSLLEALQSPDDPWPDSGFRTLLRSSTTNWKAALYKAVGAPLRTSPEKVAAAISTAIHDRADSQFQLLVNNQVSIEIPTEPLDYYDGTCWVKCRLQSGDLSAYLGLSLVRERGAWMLDSVDWRDGDRYFVD